MAAGRDRWKAKRALNEPRPSRIIKARPRKQGCSPRARKAGQTLPSLPLSRGLRGGQRLWMAPGLPVGSCPVPGCVSSGLSCPQPRGAAARHPGPSQTDGSRRATSSPFLLPSLPTPGHLQSGGKLHFWQQSPEKKKKKGRRGPSFAAGTLPVPRHGRSSSAAAQQPQGRLTASFHPGFPGTRMLPADESVGHTQSHKSPPNPAA